MFDDTLELAENKLLLLYIFNKINLPISNTQITDIILENNLINYFTLQQYITELMSSSFLKDTKISNKHKLKITEKGKKVLSLFINRVSQDKLSKIDEYLDRHIVSIKKEVTVSSDYTIENKDKFIVNLKAMKDSTTLIDIKLTVDSNQQAKDLCSRWKKNSPEIYNNILNTLLS